VLAWVPEGKARARLSKVAPGDTKAFGAWLEAFEGRVQIIDGNMRREELRQTLAVLVTDLDESEARKVLLTFDPVAAMAGRDEALLKELLGSVRTKEKGLGALLDEMRASVGAGTEAGEKPDHGAIVEILDAPDAPAFPDAPSPSVEEVLAGTARWAVVQADSLAFLRTLPDACIDALVTDAPYSSGGQFRGDRMASTTLKYVQSAQVKQDFEFTGDNRDQRSFVTWCVIWLIEAARVLKPGPPICLFTDWRQLPATTDALQAGGLVWRGIVPWDKTEQCRPSKGRFAAQCEYVVWGSNGPMPLERGVGCLWGCFREMVRQDDKFHQTGKPTALMRKVNAICTPGGIILDPFFGSGSTGAAALLDGYRVIGCEKTDAYAPIARGRVAYVEAHLAHPSLDSAP
jgi:site-specific DNA-methyltransferase (adenine-specific)